MLTSLCLTLLALALTSCAHCRTLQQGGVVIAAPGGLPSVGNGTTALSPWNNYTHEFNTLYIGVRQIVSTVAASDEACASLCNQDVRCEWFTWCPANVTGGCGIPAANGTFSSTVPPGGCITSYDDTDDRWAVYVAKGKAVPFVSGIYEPVDSTTNSSTARSGQTGRRLKQAGGGSSAVWARFTQDTNLFWQGIDGLPSTTAQTAEECAGACNANPACQIWSLCPPAVGAAGCALVSFTPNASPLMVPAGSCLLSYDGTPDQLAYFEMEGDAVAFEAGKLRSNATSTVPPPVTGPVITVPGVPGVSPPITSPTPVPPGGSSSLPAPANASNTIISTIVYGIKGVACPYHNGTAWSFAALDKTKYWAASAVPAAINWDEALDLAARLCASPAAAGPTLLSAFEQPGSEAAATAVAAAAQLCADGKRTGTHYMHAANPDADHSDGRRVLEYASKWLAAADAAGYALCVAVGQFDPDGALVPGTERFVHNPTPWNGSGNPGQTGASSRWFNPKQGQPTNCHVRNGTSFVRDTVQRFATVSSPAPIDQTDFNTYIDAVCSNPGTAGATLAAAISAGGPTADLAALGTTYMCGNSTDLAVEAANWGFPATSQDWQRAMNFTRKWVAAMDRIGYPLCVTVFFRVDGQPINATQVYPGGEAPTPVDAAGAA